MQVISVYCADVGMKMLYFGGFKDYVSKEWQRNYVRSPPWARKGYLAHKKQPPRRTLQLDYV